MKKGNRKAIIKAKGFYISRRTRNLLSWVGIALLLVSMVGVGIYHYQDEISTRSIELAKFGETAGNLMPIYDVVDTVEILLPVCEKYPVLSETANLVRERLPFYRKILKEAPLVSKGKQVDVILQEHISLMPEEMTPEISRDVELSQRRITRLLRYFNYDVIADEGLSLDPITFSGLVGEVITEGVGRGIFLSREEVEKAIRNDRYSAAVAFAIKNPSRVVIGGDDKYLNHLHALVLTNSVIEDQVGKVQYENLRRNLSSFRSDIALAKVLLKLSQNRGKKGAIIIGAQHAQRLAEVISRLGICSSFYQTYGN